MEQRPTEKQLKYIEYLASCLKVDVPKVKTKEEAGSWIDKNKPEANKPSDKQMKMIYGMCRTIKCDVPKIQSKRDAGKWIQEHEVEYNFWKIIRKEIKENACNAQNI